MGVVHVGGLRLQVGVYRSRRGFVEALIGQIEESVRYVVERCIEEALEAEVTLLLGRAWYERRQTGKRRRGELRCNRCGTQYGQDFQRDGHYKRNLGTRWGQVEISVPQVACICGGSVRVKFKTLRPRQRMWDDVEEEIRERCGWGMSLREIKEELDARLRSSVGLRTLNRRTRQIARLVPSWRQGRLEAVPPVVRVDGIWVTLMVPTGVVRKDRLGRRRAVKQARKVPILVAQGVWPASGHQEVVAWTLGRAEDEESWEQLLTQMWERGIRAERGLRLLVGDGAAGLREARRTVYWNVPFQRCIFHKLRNIRRAIVVPAGLEGKAARAYKRRLIRSAARVWQAADAQEARRRQHVFCRRWGEEQPAVAATMRRDFDVTLTFYDVQTAAAARGEVWPAHYLRTTSPLERQLRTFRRRFSQAVLFHSRSGLAAVVHQILARCAARRSGAPPLSWRSSLERALAEAVRIS